MSMLNLRNAVIELNFKNIARLRRAWIPFFQEGGLFATNTSDWKLGEYVYIMLWLSDQSLPSAVEGRVAWITPANAPKSVSGRSQGIGVHFSENDQSRIIKQRIEQLLSSYETLEADKEIMSQTF